MLRIALLLALVSVVGCASLTHLKNPPRVRLTDIRITEITLLEQQYELGLRIQNPNEKALAIKGLSFEIELNEQELLSGVSNQRVSVPGYGETVVTVKASSTLAGLIRQITGLQQSKSLEYRLRGKLSADNFGAPIPFDYSGRLLPKNSGPGNGDTI